MNNKLIYIRWLDSNISPEWAAAPNINTGLVSIETVGYLILEDKTHIELAQSSDGNEKYCGVMSIPKSTILKRYELKRKGK